MIGSDAGTTPLRDNLHRGGVLRLLGRDGRRADDLERAEELALVDVLADAHAELGELEEERRVGLRRERERLVCAHGALVCARGALELLRDVDRALDERAGGRKRVVSQTYWARN